MGDKVLIRLHRGYNILVIKTYGLKLSQQFAGLFKVTKKIRPLSYRLDIQQLKLYPLEDKAPKGSRKSLYRRRYKREPILYR